MIAIWSVTLNDGDWYWVFARSAREAVRVVQEVHYDDLTAMEFRKMYSPAVRKVDDHERLTVYLMGTKTAAEWRRGESVGPFVSNTYEM